MSKHFPPTDMQVEINAPGDIRPVLKTLDAAKAGDLYMVDPTRLDVLADFNVRVRNTDQWEEQVRSLMESIRANGFYADKPISVVADKAGEEIKLWVVDGHTRLEAVNRLIVEGVEIERVPVVVKPKTTTFEDMLVALVTNNSGKPLTPYETSLVVKRLQNYGWQDGQIASRLGITDRYVRDLVVLAGAPAKVRNLVVAGKLSSSEAVKQLRKHGEKAAEVVTAAAKKAKGGKVTGKNLRGETAEREVTMSPVLGAPYGGGASHSGDIYATAAAAVQSQGDPAADPMNAINYAVLVPADAKAWLQAWKDEDEDARDELRAWLDPNGGL